MVLEYELVKKIYQTHDLIEIKYALESILEISDKRLKSRVVSEILKYLIEKFFDNSYKVAVYICCDNSEIVGFVIAQIDPSYRSYGKLCPTFGWLRADSIETCKKLMNACENFARKHGFRKIRGPINYPKGLGGIGVQVDGFNEKLFYGVAFNPTNIADYLDKLGFKRDAEYICVHVTEKTWKKGKKIDNNIRLRFLPLKDIIAKEEEIMELASSAFNFILPDHSGSGRFDEVMRQYAAVPKTHYKLPPNFNTRKYSDIPEFIEAWESCDLENVVTWAPIAINRYIGEIVGAIFSLPDLYQLWLGESITRVNVDTVFVKPGYTGKGIFSALNNIGQITTGFNGIKYIEGTHIWNKNEEAVQSIFPHTKPLRKHIVFQKRLRALKK